MEVVSCLVPTLMDDFGVPCSPYIFLCREASSVRSVVSFAGRGAICAVGDAVPRRGVQLR